MTYRGYQQSTYFVVLLIYFLTNVRLITVPKQRKKMTKFQSMNLISQVLVSRRKNEMLIVPTELFSGRKIIGISTTHLLSEDNKKIKFHQLKEMELELFSRFIYKKYFIKPNELYVGFQK